MEEQDKFLEYCKGKLFLISWSLHGGEIIKDRWMAFGDDAVTCLNYLQSYNPSVYDVCRFKPHSYLNDSDNIMCFCLNSELDINTISPIIGEVHVVSANGGLDLTYCVQQYIKKAIGEHCGN